MKTQRKSKQNPSGRKLSATKKRARRQLVQRILIADRYTMSRNQFCTYCHEQGVARQVHPAGCWHSMLEALEARTWNIALVDCQLGDRGVGEMVREIRSRCTEVRLLLFGGDETDPLAVAEGLRAGAQGFVHRSAEWEEYQGAMEKLASGQRHIPAEIATVLVDFQMEGSLNAGERKMLQLLAAGMDNQAMARKLHISIPAVCNRKQRIRVKLGLKTPQDLIRYALLRHRGR